MKKLLSIIIPTYKRNDLLRRALLSIDCSQMDLLDVIVVDDDESMSAASIAKDFSSVRYFAKRGQDRGLAFSRNIGLTLAVGKYILFLDDDDFLYPGALDVFLSSIKFDKSFYYGDFQILTIDKTHFVSLSNVVENRLLIVNQIPVGAFMIEKAAIKSMFDTSMKSHEDWNFLLMNIVWEDAVYLENIMVNIDKSLEGEQSMQNRRKDFFWMEFINIYSRFPAPELAQKRVDRISLLGAVIPVDALKFSDVY